MTLEDIINWLLTLTIWQVVKFFYLLVIFLYLIFSIIIIRQVDLMTETLNGVLNLPLKAIAWAHFIFALGIFILAIVLL